MKVVNLSRRPFVNRRPIVRLGIALWVLGGLLVLVNLGLFRSYWTDSRDVRAELESTQAQVAAELQELEELDRQVDRVNLTLQNSQATYLNSLISYRTFPWSALFDDLERVMPLEVRLQTVTPDVRLAAAEAVAQAERAARQDRADTRRNRRNRRTGANSSRPSGTADTAETLASDEVGLQLRGTAKTEDALIEFVDTLYQDPSFRRPVLSGESIGNVGGQLNSSFEITVIYLTGERGGASADDVEASGVTGDQADLSQDPAPQAPAAVPPTVLSAAPAAVDVGTAGDIAAPPPASASSLPRATPPPAAPVARSAPQPNAEDRESSSASRDRAAPRERPAANTPESAADERRQRIEELRQRRREAIRRSRSSASRRASGGGFLGNAEERRGTRGGTSGDSGRRSSRDTRPAGSNDDSGDSGSSGDSGDRRTDTPSASGTPRVRGSLVPGLPEILEKMWASPPSPFAESLEELG